MPNGNCAYWVEGCHQQGLNVPRSKKRGDRLDKIHEGWPGLIISHLLIEAKCLRRPEAPMHRCANLRSNRGFLQWASPWTPIIIHPNNYKHRNDQHRKMPEGVLACTFHGNMRNVTGTLERTWAETSEKGGVWS